jgi:Uma2 family endonuclease
MSQELLSEEIAIPDISHLVLEDDVPVDNFQSEKQQRLLVEPLYSSSVLPTPFIAAANVGIFYAINQDGSAPDAFLSLGVQMPADWSQRQNRSYLVWQLGKVPEVVIEVVSNRKGNELGSKKEDYARMKVDYYAVFDPLQQIQGSEQMDGALLKIWSLTVGRYQELTDGIGGIGQPILLESIDLGLTLWEGDYEDTSGIWLRWCDRNGILLPTGKERAIEAEERASEAEEQLVQERREKERLRSHLQAMGINPDTLEPFNNRVVEE